MKIDTIKNKMWQLCRATLVVSALCLATNCTEEEPADSLYAPTLENQGATNLARTSVTLSGKITGNTAAIIEYGFKCSTSEAFPSDQTTKVIVDSPISSGTFSAEITDLSPNQHYYYCLYATTGSSTLQADAGEFTTISTATPTFGELKVDSVGENVIRLICSIDEIGDNYLIEYGVSYKTEASNTYIPIAAESFTNATTREYMISITGLQAETDYIVRPYAKNSSTSTGEEGVLEGYGDTQTITTESLLSPDVTTKEIGNPGINAITISGVVTAAVGSDGVLDECGFCWSSTNTEPTVLDDTIHVEVKELNTTFTASIENLKASTKYYIRAYSKNTVNGQERYGYGDVKTFETSSLVTPVLTIDETSTTATSITATASITNYDANALIEKGFVWSTSNAQVEIGDTGASTLKVESGENIFNATLTGLTINQRYYLRAYAIYEASGVQQTGYSSYQTLTTEAFKTVTFDELKVSDITYTSAKVQVGMTDLGNAEIVEKGFCWSTASQPKTTDSKQKVDEGFELNISELQTGTTYYVRAYAICRIENEEQTAYSGESAFTTSTVGTPQVELNDIPATSATTITANATFVNYDAESFVEKGFIWSKSDAAVTVETAGSNILKVDSESNIYSATIENLDINQRYYVRAYAIQEIAGVKKTGYSGSWEVNTQDFRGVALNIEVKETTYNSATVQGAFADWGNAKVIEKGFCWISGNTTPTIENGEKQAVTGDDFSLTITGLTYGTSYRVRAYAICQIGDTQQTSYSGSNYFTTENMQLVSFDNLDITDQTYNSAKVKTVITDWGNVEVLEKGFCWSLNNVEATIESNKVVVGSDEFSASITGLTYGTQYRVRAYAICKLGDVTDTSYSGTHWFDTTTPQKAEIQLNRNWAESTAFTNYFTAKITTVGDFETTEVGIFWRRVVDSWNWPSYDDCDGKMALTLNEDGTYSGIHSVLPGQHYMYSVYTKMNADGTEILHKDYGGLSTSARDLTVETFQSSATDSSFTVSATIEELKYATNLQEVGFAYLKEPSTVNHDWSLATKVKCEVADDGTISTTVSDLPGGVYYEVRPYVILKEGTFFDDNSWGITTRRAPQEDDNTSPDKTEK